MGRKSKGLRFGFATIQQEKTAQFIPTFDAWNSHYWSWGKRVDLVKGLSFYNYARAHESCLDNTKAPLSKCIIINKFQCRKMLSKIQKSLDK